MTYSRLSNHRRLKGRAYLPWFISVIIIIALIASAVSIGIISRKNQAEAADGTVSCGARTETSVCDAQITDLINPNSNKSINGTKPDGTVVSNSENMAPWNLYKMTVKVHIADINKVPESGLKIQIGSKSISLQDGILYNSAAVQNIVDGDKIFFNNNVKYMNNDVFLILKPTHDAFNSNIVDVSYNIDIFFHSTTTPSDATMDTRWFAGDESIVYIAHFYYDNRMWKSTSTRPRINFQNDGRANYARTWLEASGYVNDLIDNKMKYDNWMYQNYYTFLSFHMTSDEAYRMEFNGGLGDIPDGSTGNMNVNTYKYIITDGSGSPKNYVASKRGEGWAGSMIFKATRDDSLADDSSLVDFRTAADGVEKCSAKFGYSDINNNAYILVNFGPLIGGSTACWRNSGMYDHQSNYPDQVNNAIDKAAAIGLYINSSSYMDTIRIVTIPSIYSSYQYSSYNGIYNDYKQPVINDHNALNPDPPTQIGGKYMYYIKYNANTESTGNTVVINHDMKNSSAERGKDITIPSISDSFKDNLNGWILTGWNTCKNPSQPASGEQCTAYAPGDAYKTNGGESSKTLYAQWRENKHDVSYSNGVKTDGTTPSSNEITGTIPASASYRVGSSVSIDSILGTTSRKYAFSLWKGSDGKYYCKNGTGNGSTKDKCAGSLSMPDNDFILTAQWIERKKSKISFNANQNADNTGTSKQLPSWMVVQNMPVDNDEHYIGEQYTIPSVRPTADSSVVFMGWKIMKNGAEDTMKTLQPGDKIQLDAASYEFIAQWNSIKPEYNEPNEIPAVYEGVFPMTGSHAIIILLMIVLTAIIIIPVILIRSRKH